MARVVIVGAAIVRHGKVLAQQRAWPADHAGQWELPGGRVEEGEDDQAALARECLEELDVAVTVGERVGDDVPLPGGKVLRIYAASLVSPADEPRAVEHKDVRWLSPTELDDLEWLPADRILLPALHALITNFSRRPATGCPPPSAPDRSAGTAGRRRGPSTSP